MHARHRLRTKLFTVDWGVSARQKDRDTFKFRRLPVKKLGTA